jgi:hypothetical protein
VRQALAIDGASAVATHRIEADDAAMVSHCPADWKERSRRKRLLYSSLSDCIAERIHTSRRCHEILNPKADLDALKPGDVLRVPSLRKRSLPVGAAAVEIDLGRKMILAIDGGGAIVGLLHCSVARDVASVERGETRIASTVKDPTYTFDPKKWPEVKDVDRRLLIPPGPRSPVGLRWIGLERPGVGIHGTPEPENIGKTGSHGCFRLTNWDAVYLSSFVSVGMTVRIVDSSPALDGLAPPTETASTP